MNEFELKIVNSNTQFKIKRHTLDWDDIIKDLDGELYEKIVDIIFDESNLYYYTTAKPEAKQYIDSLTERQKLIALKSFMGIIKNPENCLNSNEIYNSFLKYVDSLKIDGMKTEEEKKEDLLSYLNMLDLEGIKGEQEFDKIVRQANVKLANESRNGIFAEVLFYKVIDSFINNTYVLFSKIPAISAAGTYAHGSDGIFIEVENNEICIGFGEAKFCKSIDNAITQVQSSISDFERLANDINWMSRNLNARKSYSKELDEALELIKINDQIEDIDLGLIDIKSVKKKIFVFMLYGDGNFYLKDIEDKLSRRNIKLENFEINIICFPIIEKTKLVSKLMERVNSHAK